MNTFNSRMDIIENKLLDMSNTMKNNFGEIENRLGIIEDRIDSIVSRVNSIERFVNMVAKNDEKIRRVTKKFEDALPQIWEKARANEEELKSKFMKNLLTNNSLKKRKKLLVQNSFKVSKPTPFHSMSKKEQKESIRAMKDD